MQFPEFLAFACKLDDNELPCDECDPSLGPSIEARLGWFTREMSNFRFGLLSEDACEGFIM